MTGLGPQPRCPRPAPRQRPRPPGREAAGAPLTRLYPASHPCLCDEGGKMSPGPPCSAPVGEPSAPQGPSEPTRGRGAVPAHPPAALSSPPCWVATHLRVPRPLMFPSPCRSLVSPEAVTGGKKPPLFISALGYVKKLDQTRGSTANSGFPALETLRRPLRAGKVVTRGSVYKIIIAGFFQTLNIYRLETIINALLMILPAHTHRGIRKKGNNSRKDGVLSSGGASSAA